MNLVIDYTEAKRRVQKDGIYRRTFREVAIKIAQNNFGLWIEVPGNKGFGCFSCCLYRSLRGQLMLTSLKNIGTILIKLTKNAHFNPLLYISIKFVLAKLMTDTSQQRRPSNKL